MPHINRFRRSLLSGKNMSKEKLRKKCVQLAKLIAKEMAGWRCEYDGCFRTKAAGFQMQGAHIFGENSHKSMSADIDNILCLCPVHHTGGFWKNAKEPSWHEDPLVMVEWFRKKYPKRYKELLKRSRITNKTSELFWKRKLSELRKTFESLKKNKCHSIH